MADFQRLDIDILNRLLKRRFMRFLAVGSFTTTIDFGIFYLLHFHGKLGIAPANIISYGTGITAAFFINRIWTFHDAMHRSHRLIVLSFLYGYIGLALNTVIVWGLSFSIPAMLAKTLAVLIIVMYNYLTNKYLIFRVHE